jgi:hemerythrin-like metal-binding protein
MPGIILWDESCSVGLDELDEAHRHLFDIGNRMIRAVAERRGETEAREVIEEMIEYAEQHFAREEVLMQASRYPGYAEHRTIHERLMNEIRLIKSQFIAGNLNSSLVAAFLREWMVDHIKKTDKDYSAFVGSLAALP